jgi:hypothetical protein
MSSRARKRSPLDRARSALGALDRVELEALKADIEALLGATPPAQTGNHAPSPSGGGTDAPPRASSAQGHVELKMVNGYGPYKYLRRLEGGHLRSIYLGKASPADIRRYAVKRKRKT